MGTKKGTHKQMAAGYSFRPKAETYKFHECDKLVDFSRIIHGIVTLPSGKELLATKTHDPLPTYRDVTGKVIPRICYFKITHYENSDRENGRPFGDDEVAEGISYVRE